MEIITLIQTLLGGSNERGTCSNRESNHNIFHPSHLCSVNWKATNWKPDYV